MAAEIHIRDTTWKRATEVHIRHADTWKECLEVWIRDTGAWVQTYLKEALSWSGAAESNTTVEVGLGIPAERNGFRMNADGSCSICDDFGVYQTSSQRWCDVTPANISAYEMKWTNINQTPGTNPGSYNVYQNMAAFEWEFAAIQAMRETTLTITVRKDGNAGSEQVGTVFLSQEWEP